MNNKAIATIDGELIDKCVIIDNDGEVQGYTIKKNEVLVDIYIYNFVKTKWIGTEWIETATEEEIKEAYPTIEVQPTIADRVADVEIALAKVLGGV